MAHSFSDHCPLFIQTDCDGPRTVSRRKKFEAWWCLEDTCEEKVKSLWFNSHGSVPDRLQVVLLGLKDWAVKINSKQRLLTEKLLRRMEDLDGEDRTDELLAEIIDLKLQFNFEAEKEERYWEQRARVNWLTHGDKNTFFFHKFATTRKSHNRINGLCDENGNLCSENGLLSC